MLLITIAAGPDRGRALRLADDAPHIIGRKNGNGSLELEDPKVSRKHAELIAFADGQVMIKDLGSRNGTYVDKKKISGPTALRNGAVVQVGQTVFVVSWVAEPATAPATVPPPEWIESQQQAQRILEEVREGLAQLKAAPVEPALSSTHLEAAQAAILQRLDELSQRLGQLSDAAERHEPQLQAILAAQSRPLSATEAMAAELSELHRKLDALAAEARPAYDDTAVHVRLDEMVDALHRLAEPEPQPQWVAGLEQSIAASHAATVEAIGRHVDAMAAAADSRPALEAVGVKVQALVDAMAALPETADSHDTTQAKLDSVLDALRAVPAGADTSALTEKLDDLLALVAALRLPHPVTGAAAAPAMIGEVETRLDAILRAVSTLGEAVLERPAHDSGSQEALLLHIAERIDALGPQSGPTTTAPAEDLLAEVDRHWMRLEERLMQHLRGTSEAAEGQLRKALSDLTGAVRSMAQRSDRAVLEQVLAELRGQGTDAIHQALAEISDKLRRLPTGPAPAPAAESQAIAAAVRQGLEQVGEQLEALPARLDNNLVLGDILDLLRSIERNQRRQSQWMLNLDEKLDSLSAAETAVFAPITDVPLGAANEGSSVTSQL